MCQVPTHCGFSRVSPDENCAYVHWGSFTSNSRSVRRTIWFTWFSEPHECIQHLAVPGNHPSNYEPGATLLDSSEPTTMSERRMPFHVSNIVHWPRRSIAWFIKRKTIILIDINYISSNAFINVIRSWLKSDPVTVGLSSGAFPKLLLTKRSRTFCPLLYAVTHCL